MRCSQCKTPYFVSTNTVYLLRFERCTCRCVITFVEYKEYSTSDAKLFRGHNIITSCCYYDHHEKCCVHMITKVVVEIAGLSFPHDERYCIEKTPAASIRPAQRPENETQKSVAIATKMKVPAFLQLRLVPPTSHQQPEEKLFRQTTFEEQQKKNTDEVTDKTFPDVEVLLRKRS
ncbi:hypothetical protein CEXT_720911 [Caerostris extrusa]|uniref:SWIM-type domain-containing protein n=1 Tax=Caerostris extrusa TaxID=172846 RepID=A0AAV4M8S9_CAEEX|nr:hypothetical protein CEXT_720911 [Caerostris extrusa]